MNLLCGPLVRALPLKGGHGREGFALGASPDVNDFWQF